jgi:IS1 family transposase
MVKIMLVRGIGIRDINVTLNTSITKVLKVLEKTKYTIKPKQTHYDRLEIDEFWTYAGKKKNKLWLIYAYHRETGEIVAFVRGKRDLKTAQKLRKRIQRLGITYDRLATDTRDSFPAAFAEDPHPAGKQYTAGIEGNNCRYGIESGGRLEEPSVFPKSCLTTGRRSIWPFSTSIMASFDIHHTLWITTFIFKYFPFHPTGFFPLCCFSGGDKYITP